VNEGYRCHNERCNKCNINKPQWKKYLRV
jgi:hypothetical protein